MDTGPAQLGLISHYIHDTVRENIGYYRLHFFLRLEFQNFSIKKAVCLIKV